MKVKNNYQECITNLACSIEKYFDLTPKHNTLSYVDKLLEEKKPENVVVILLDGLGSRILDRSLDENAFLRKHKVKEITSVFPATTTAATSSMQTGLNPVEHGYLGWNIYMEPIDKVITIYMNTEKGKEVPDQDFLNIKDQYYKLHTIPERIEEEKKGRGIELFPFQKDIYQGLDDMLEKIKNYTKEPGKKYIYAYNTEPDSTMHRLGPDSKEAQALIQERNDKIEALSKELDNTILFVIADHGHKKINNVYLEDYEDLFSLLKTTTSLEQRAVSFHVKDGKQDKFKKLFNQYFGQDFTLYTKEEVIESKLFGDGEEHPLFRSSLGDFIAIAEDSDKSLVAPYDDVLYSQHAGYSDDEVYIPLIIVDKTTNLWYFKASQTKKGVENMRYLFTQKMKSKYNIAVVVEKPGVFHVF